MITRLHHAQITIPKGAEQEAKRFYCEGLGLREIPKPDSLAGRGGFWLSVGNQEVHVGVEDGVHRTVTKAHLAYEVDNVRRWRDVLSQQRVEMLDNAAIPGFERFEFRDPFGNRVELIQRLIGVSSAVAHAIPSLETFTRLASRGNLVPVFRRVLSDQLTPVLAYRRLVRPDDRMAPSFLLESVEGGDKVGRYSFLGAQPDAQVIARGHDVQFIDTRKPANSRTFKSNDPLREMDKLTSRWKLVKLQGGDISGGKRTDDLPDFTGGWVGFAGYDTVRYLEGEKLPSPPRDDRGLPDMHMALYRKVVAFDNVRKTVLLITHAVLDEYATPQAAYDAALRELDEMVARIETPAIRPSAISHQPSAISPELPIGEVDLDSPPPALPASNMGEGGYQRAVLAAKEYIKAGDIFQVVPSQRFEVRTKADPFDIYRALRVVNPSPYMFYVQIAGGMLIGSSPEILCRVHNGEVWNRPLAGTRRRGRTKEEDIALEKELLADPKEICEHVMLVDLGRNDVGRVARAGSITVPVVMEVERYSHVMHISSTVLGKLRDGFTCWDALQAALPVGTVSGAPKVRAMQVIDELEPTRRGPYAGAVGYTDFAGNMDMAIALRTMVVMPAKGKESGDRSQGTAEGNAHALTSVGTWTVHIQTGAGIVADSVPDSEHQECVSKAAALAKAVDVAERAFT